MGTVISKEPEIIRILQKRQPIFPNVRVFRDDILLRAALIGERLRDPEFFANYAASSILGFVFSSVLGRI